MFLQPLGDGSELVHSLTIERPCGDKQLWLDVISTLRLGNGVLYFPGGKPLIADPSTARHLPDDMLEALGEPSVVEGPKDILDYMKTV